MITNYSTKKLIRSGLFVLMLFYAPEALAGVIGRAPNNLGLVGYWSFNDATSTTRSTLVQDFSGNNNNGVMTNMANPATAASGVTDGRLGKALNFDGTNDYVGIGTGLGSLVNFTVSMWFKPNATDVYQDLIGKDNDINGFRLQILATNNKMFMRTYSAGGNSDLSATITTLASGTWYHLVWQYNGTNGIMYVNGALEITSGMTAPGANGNVAFDIGRVAGATRVNGLIDEVRIYNRALSASEVAALYKTGAAKFTPPSNLGLVGYWSFNDATSTNTSYPNRAIDFSGNGNTGVLTNGPTWSTGRLGKALNFDGVDDYVNVPAAAGSPLLTTRFTISLWINGTVAGGVSATVRQPIAMGTLVSNTNYLFSWTHSSGDFDRRFAFSNSAGDSWFTSNAAGTLNANTWYHIVGTYDGSLFTAYLDGRTTGGNSVTATPNTSATALTIGSTAGTSPFPGLIDEVRIYNRALTAAEVAALYKTGAAKFTPPSNLGLVGYWSFNDATSTNTSYPNRAIDFSGNGNTGVLTNGPVWSTSRLGKALNFDGVNDYVDVADTPSLRVTTDFTISAWANATRFDTGPAIISKDASDFTGWRLAFNGSGQLRFNPGGGNLDSVVFAKTNTWVFVTVTHTGGNYSFYLNGAFDVTRAFSDPAQLTYDVFIGKIRGGSGSLFTGLLDEVRIYNRALSAAEVLSLYNSR